MAVGSQSRWRMTTPLAARLQNSHQNGGRIFLIFVADPITVRLRRTASLMAGTRGGGLRLLLIEQHERIECSVLGTEALLGFQGPFVVNTAISAARASRRVEQLQVASPHAADVTE
jgi:hypothetical protein